MKATFGFAVFIVSYLLVSSNQYAVEKAIADEQQEAKQQAPVQYAPIRPAKCSEFAAGKADNGKWELLYCKRGTRA